MGNRKGTPSDPTTRLADGGQAVGTRRCEARDAADGKPTNSHLVMAIAGWYQKSLTATLPTYGEAAD